MSSFETIKINKNPIRIEVATIIIAINPRHPNPLYPVFNISSSFII